MWQNVVAIAILILLSSLKFIVFGWGNTYNSASCDFIQFLVFSHLFMNWNIPDAIQIGFFGLSPAGLDDSFINHIWQSLDPSNGRRLDETEDLHEMVTWINDHKFLLTVVVIFSIINIFAIVKTIKYHILEKFDCFRRRKLALTYDNLIKIFLIAYCNIATITVYQLNYFLSHSIIDEIALFLLTLCVTSFVVLGFPLFCFNLLSTSSGELFDTRFRRNYGTLFNQFKLGCYRFNVLILGKQLSYAVIINVSNDLTLLQNHLFLGINVFYLMAISWFKPYDRERDQLQALLLTICAAILTTINYPFITDSPTMLVDIATWTSVIVHAISILITGGFMLYNHFKPVEDISIVQDSDSDSEQTTVQMVLMSEEEAEIIDMYASTEEDEHDVENVMDIPAWAMTAYIERDDKMTD